MRSFLRTGTLALVALTASPALATLTFHIHGEIPEEYRNKEFFVHFTLAGDPSTPQDQVSINKFSTDGFNYYSSDVGNVNGMLPGNVVLVDDNSQLNYAVYTQRITFGTYMSFDVVLKGGQFEGSIPVSANSYEDFYLRIYNPDLGYILENGSQFASVDIYRDSSGLLTIEANPNFTVTAVPEPATIGALAISSLLLWRRRSR